MRSIATDVDHTKRNLFVLPALVDGPSEGANQKLPDASKDEVLDLRHGSPRDVSEIGDAAGQSNAGDASIEGLVRVLDGGVTQFDDDALKDAAEFKRTEFTEDAFELSMPSDSADIVLDHLVLHLGSAHKHKCRACYLAKKARKQARRRPTSGRADLDSNS